MPLRGALSATHWKGLWERRPLWTVVAALAVIGLLHYVTPQARVLPPPIHMFLSRHAVERTLFVLPMALATFAFGRRGGLLTIGAAVVLMLPRALWLSPQRADALVETAAAALVGYLVTLMIGALEREKTMRQKAVARLSAANAVAATLAGSLELQQILSGALEKVLEVMGLEAGLIFLLNPRRRALDLRAHRGVSEKLASELGQSNWEEPWVRVARSGRPVVVQNVPEGWPALGREGIRSAVVVPIHSKESVVGVLAVGSRAFRQVQPEDLELITGIGNEIGVAVENARLYESMRYYVRQITRAQEDERKRIARELHDETIQALVVVSRRLEALSMLSEGLPREAQDRIASLHELLGETVRGVRRFVQDLRPPMLDHLGLVASVEALVSELREKNGIDASLRVNGIPRRLLPDEELVLFRIAQEALNNARRHAGASEVAIELGFGPNEVRLAVADDGRGFRAPERTEDLLSEGKLGLIGMHERARTLGGSLEVQSEEGRGAVISVAIPAQLPSAQESG